MVLVTLSLVSLASVNVAAGDWSQYQGDHGNTGVLEGESHLDETWVYEAGAEVASTVAVSEDVAYFVDGNGTLHAVEVGSDDALWRSESRSPVGHEQVNLNTPVLSDGRVFVVDQDMGVTALDGDGDVLWTRHPTGRPGPDGEPVTVPAVDDDVLGFGTGEVFYGVDARFGGTKYRVDVGGGLKMPVSWDDGFVLNAYDMQAVPPTGSVLSVADGSSTEIYSGFASSGPPAIGDGKVYVTEFRGDLVAVDRSSGDVDWEVSAGFGASPPSFRDGVVYVGSSQGAVRAFDSGDGEELWAFGVGGGVVHTPAVSPERVYVASSDGVVLSLERDTGELIWGVRLEDGVDHPVSVGGDTVFVSSGDRVYGFVDGEPAEDVGYVDYDELPGFDVGPPEKHGVPRGSVEMEFDAESREDWDAGDADGREDHGDTMRDEEVESDGPQVDNPEEVETPSTRALYSVLAPFAAASFVALLAILGFYLYRRE